MREWREGVALLVMAVLIIVVALAFLNPVTSVITYDHGQQLESP